MFTHELNFNVLHSIYLRGLAGALFVEAGVVSPCESYAPDSKSVAADVGYSIRIFADWFALPCPQQEITRPAAERWTAGARQRPL